MGLIKLFQRWMLFSTTLTLQTAATATFHYEAGVFENRLFVFAFFNIKFIDTNIKQNLKPLNPSVHIK